MVKYSYVRLFSNIHSDLNIIYSDPDIQSLLLNYRSGILLLLFGFRFGFFESDSDTDSNIG